MEDSVNLRKGMFYKIFSKKFPEKLEETIDLLKEDYNCIYADRFLYICPEHYNPKLSLDPDFFNSDFFVTELTKDDLSYEDEHISAWFNENTLRLFNEKVEEEHQDKLREMLAMIDAMDAEIERMKQTGEYDEIVNN